MDKAILLIFNKISAQKMVEWQIFRNFKGDNQLVTLKNEAT